MIMGEALDESMSKSMTMTMHEQESVKKLPFPKEKFMECEEEDFRPVINAVDIGKGDEIYYEEVNEEEEKEQEQENNEIKDKD